MDVFVIPTGRDRYELYCEKSIAPADPAAPGTGVVARWRQRVTDVLRAAEARRQHAPTPALESWRERMQDRAMCWLAERIAEQRLLWNLQRESSVAMAHPDDITGEQAVILVQQMLQRDYDRHRRWMIIDGILFVVTFVVLGPFFLLVPGIANLPALYFGFRFFGHLLSMRGAAQGRRRVTWVSTPSARLTELRGLLDVAPPVREARVREIAAHLRLQHLATFLDRVAVHHA